MYDFVHAIFIVDSRISRRMFEGVHVDRVFRRTSGGEWHRRSRASHLVHVHLFTADESISVFVRHVCLRLLNACAVTLAIVGVKRLVSVQTNDVVV